MGEETDGYVESTSKLQEKIKGITGVDIMLDKDTFKDIYDIVVEIGDVWNDLTDIQQADVLETLAGKNQSNRLAAALSNVEQLKAAYSSAINADGSAEKEQANWANSIQYSIDRVKASLETLSYDALDSDVLKNAVDLFDKLVNLVDTLVKHLGVLAPLIVTTFTAKSVMGAGGVKALLSNAKESNFKLRDMEKYNALLAKQSELQDKLSTGNLSSEQTAEIGKELATVNAQIGEAKDGWTKFGEVVKGVGIAFAASFSVEIINSLITASDRLKASVTDAVESYYNQANSVDDVLSQIKTQQDILTSSTSSYQSQVEARKQLYEIQGKLVDTFGAEASGIRLVTDDVNELTTAIESLNGIKNASTMLDDIKDEINDSDGFFDSIGDAIVRMYHGVNLNEDVAIADYENANLGLDFSFIDTDNEHVKDFIAQLKELYSLKGYDSSLLDDGIVSIQGNAEELSAVADEIERLASIYNVDGSLNDFADAVTIARRNIDSLVDSYSEFYKLNKLQEEVFDSAKGVKLANNVKDTAAQYEKALVSGNEDDLKAVKQEALKILNDATFQSLSSEAQQYLLELYPQLKAQIESWKFKLRFESDYDGTDSIDKNEFEQHTQSFSNTGELEDALNGKVTDAQQQTDVQYFRNLGIDTATLIGYLQETGILTSEVSQHFNEAISRFANDASDGFEELKAKTAGWSDEEKASSIDAIKDANNLTEALKAVSDAYSATSEELSSSKLLGKWNDEVGTGFSKLNDIYDDIADGATFDFTKLTDADLGQTFSGSEEELNALIDQIAKAPDDITAAQDAINALATSFVQTKFGTDGLTESNKDLIASYLESQGVANSEAVAADMVAKANAEAAYQKLQAANVGNEQLAIEQLVANALQLEAEGATADANAMLRLALEKANASGTILTDATIQNLADECTRLGIATTAWANYYAAKSGFGSGKYTTNSDEYAGSEELANQRLAKLNGQVAINASKNEVEKNETPLSRTPTIFGGNNVSKDTGSNTGDKSNTDNEKDETEKFVDFYERRIDVLEKYHDKLDDVASDETESYAERSAAIKSIVAQDAETIATMQAQLTSLDNTFKGKIEELKKLADENGNITFQQYDEEGNLKDTVLTMAEFVELVKSGGLKSGQFIGDVADAVDEVITAYDEWYDATEKLDDKQKEAAEHRKEELDLELERLDAIQSVLEAEASISEGQIDLAEATGKLVTAGMYNDLIQNADDQIDILQEKISSYESYLDSLEDSDSSEYYETLAALESCNEEILQLTVNQAEWNEKIKDIPINLLDQYLQRLKAIQGLVENFISIQTAYGKATTSDQYSELFKTAGDNIEYAIKQQNLLKDKLSGYEWGSDKYNETAEQIESINDDLSSILEQMVEWNKEILEIPINKLNSVNDQLELVITAMEDIESEYEQVISAVTDSIDKQIDDINEEQEAYDDAVQDRIDKIQELIDALQAEQEARQKLLDVEDAQYDLEEARTQKSVAVIKNGSITYETDQEAEREAQQQLDEAEFEYRIYQLQQQIEQLEKEKEDKDEAYQNEIDNLEKISNKWSEIASNIELAKNQLKATEYLGEGWLNKVLTGDDAEIYYQFKTLYETMDADLTQYQQQVDSNQRIATLMEQFVTQYESGAITYEQCLNGINTLVNSLTGGLGVNETLDSYKELFSGSSMTALSDVLTKLQGSAQTEADNFSKYLSLYKSNEEVISKYTSSWEELKKSVDEQIAALKAAYEAALAAATAMKSYATSSHHSSGNGSSGGGGSSGGYTIAGANYEVVNGKVHYIQGSGVTAAEAAASTGAIEGSGRTYHVSSGTTTTSSKASSSSSSGGVIRDSNAKKYTRHNGVEGGLVGHASSDEKFDIIKKMSLTPLKDNEVPMLLKDGEAVLTQNQQSMLLSNMRTLRNLPTNSSLGGVNVNLSMSNLTFNEINNGQDFANFITKNLSNAISQSMAK